MASPIVLHQISLDIQKLEESLSRAQTSAKGLLVLHEKPIVMAALVDLRDALCAINESALKARVRINMALDELKGGRK